MKRIGVSCEFLVSYCLQLSSQFLYIPFFLVTFHSIYRFFLKPFSAFNMNSFLVSSKNFPPVSEKRSAFAFSSHSYSSSLHFFQILSISFLFSAPYILTLRSFIVPWASILDALINSFLAYFWVSIKLSRSMDISITYAYGALSNLNEKKTSLIH